MKKTTQNYDVLAAEADVTRCKAELDAANDAAKAAGDKLQEAIKRRMKAYEKADDLLPQCEVECLSPRMSATSARFRGVILRQTKAGSLVVRLFGVPTAKQRIFKQQKGKEGFWCYEPRLVAYRLKSVPPEYLPAGSD